MERGGTGGGAEVPDGRQGAVPVRSPRRAHHQRGSPRPAVSTCGMDHLPEPADPGDQRQDQRQPRIQDVALRRDQAPGAHEPRGSDTPSPRAKMFAVIGDANGICASRRSCSTPLHGRLQGLRPAPGWSFDRRGVHLAQLDEIGRNITDRALITARLGLTGEGRHPPSTGGSRRRSPQAVRRGEDRPGRVRGAEGLLPRPPVPNGAGVPASLRHRRLAEAITGFAVQVTLPRILEPRKGRSSSISPRPTSPTRRH